MRAELSAAERRFEVRQAARSWHRAGAVGEKAFAEIQTLYADDRVRFGPVFRGLLFFFSLIAVQAAFGFVMVLLDLPGDGLAILALLMGAALAGTTELLQGPARLSRAGAEEATALTAVGFLLGAGAWFLFDRLKLDEVGIWGLLLLAAFLCSAAFWRWGMPVFAAACAVVVLLLIARVPLGRLLWLVAALAAVPVLLQAAWRSALAPSHRQGALFAAAIALGAAYLALHLGSFDAGWIEKLGGRRPGLASWQRPLAVLGTALLPVALLIWGFRRRSRLLLAAGALAGISSLATAAVYLELRPVWLLLAVGGALLLAAALVLRRSLASGPEAERGGLTAEVLYEEEEEEAEVAGMAVAAAVPSPAAEQPPDRFEGGGGEFGGGGASQSF